jgi:two-component system, OmpR family, phosphate regulon sensor histidine kinase PhoR
MSFPNILFHYGYHENRPFFMHEYTLEFSTAQPAPANDTGPKNTLFFSSLSVENIFLYCLFRWVVIAVLILFGIVSAFPGILDTFYLRSNLHWPFVIAGLLVIMNILVLRHARSISKTGNERSIYVNMWHQIFFDLILLTLVVHYVGSLVTAIPFAYLFHIVLACIFFSRAQSFLVFLYASLLFVLCVALESTGLIIPVSVYGETVFRSFAAPGPMNVIIPVFSTLAIFFVLWYLVSQLSDLVRKRDTELVFSNRRLKETQEEKSKHLLWLTHELKAPLSAIDANIQLIQKGHCGVLPDKAIEVLERISARSRKLGLEIQEMLQLTNLRTVRKETLRWLPLDLSEIIEWCLAQLQPSAEERSIRIDKNLQSVFVVTNEDHMKMLLLNVISNAVNYSKNNGHVSIECISLPDAGPMVVIEDHGIGIEPGKLDKIFNEYYHTVEAVRHNKNSTGLGLTIVKHVAQINNLSIRVVSSPDEGTRFEIRFPGAIPKVPDSGKEKNDVLCYDHR